MANTIQALKRFQRAAQAHGVDKIRVVGTAAMREARNGAAFQAWVKAETGWTMEIISGLEEGRLIHLGVMAGEGGKSEPGKSGLGLGGRLLLVDLGGGSCEITLSEKKRIKETISVPLGAVRLTEEFLTADPPTQDGLARMRRWIGRELRRAHRKIQPAGALSMIGTSGTAAALSDACGAASKSVRKQVSKSASQRASNSAGMAATKDVRRLATRLVKMTLLERESVEGIGPRRAEIIVAGAEVFAELLESFGLIGFRYSPLGLRDGILAQMLAEQDARAKAHREFEHERWESVLARRGAMGSIPGRQKRFGPTPSSSTWI
jgi:exopolyphosphatase/guanosine-5'-triphosphate,3'-diphosphate pyrophosphatase